MIHHRIDPYKFHCYWPSLIEDELAEFKRIEYIKWKDEVVMQPRRGRSVWPAEKRNDREGITNLSTQVELPHHAVVVHQI
jgi:hypothetical protein